jgi:site-specific DNA-methyltransferase (adenine-specific)
MNAELVPRNLAPGMVPAGFAERILERCPNVDETLLWETATTCAALAQKWNGHGAEKNEIKSAQMFVEVELGQRLGPRPGAGPGRGKKPWHGKLSIPEPVISDLRRFYGHQELLVALVREGKRSRRALLLAVDRALAVNVAPEQLEIVPGDFREVLDIDADSVALVLTDPPYPAEYLPLWSDLAKHASQWLMPGGSLVAYCGQSILLDAGERLSRHLRYWWTFALLHQHGTAMIPGKWVSAGWKPMLWFVRDNRRNQFMLADRIDGTPPRKTLPTGDTDDWAQGVEELEPIISGLTEPGDLIVDPFSGSGNVGLAALRFGRRFVGATL